MKITKSYLKHIIKEEIDEGFFSSLMGKKEEKPMQLSLETVKNVIKSFSRRFQDLAQQIEEMQKTFGKDQIDKVMLVGNEIKFGNVPANLQNKNKVTMQQRGVGEVDISLKTPKSNQTLFKFDPSKEEDQKIVKKLQHAATMGQNPIEENKRGNQMKITKSALKQIIKEELEEMSVMPQGPVDPEVVLGPGDPMVMANRIVDMALQALDRGDREEAARLLAQASKALAG